MSFLQNFRNAFGQKSFTKYDPIGDRRAQDAAAVEQKIPLTHTQARELERIDSLKKYNNAANSRRMASNGNLDVNIDPYSNPAFRSVDDRFARTASEDVFKNYDALNKVVDKYDEAPTIPQKLDVIKKAWNDLDAGNWGDQDWFYAFSGWTQEAEDKGGDTREVSNLMRQINNVAKNKFTKML